MRVWVGVVALACATAAAAEPRFFVAGEGELAVKNAHTGEQVRVRYRRRAGTYDPAAFEKLQRVFRSRGDGKEGPLTPRFVEMLGRVYDMTDRQPLLLQSGYRSPSYNDAIRKKGAKAASASMHTEGMAADIAFPKAGLRDLWLRIRALECCGAGYYAKSGFLHLDVGRPRFWEAHTSGVGKNLSAENARLFARTDYDVYRAGDPIFVTLHAMTLPPVSFRPALEPTGRIALPAAVGGCVETDARTRIVIEGVAPIDRAPLGLIPCDPRPGATPERIDTNPISVRPPTP